MDKRKVKNRERERERDACSYLLNEIETPTNRSICVCRRWTMSCSTVGFYFKTWIIRTTAWAPAYIACM